MKAVAAVLALCACVALLVEAPLRAQGLDSTARTHMREIVHRVQSVIRSTYYDPTFKGIDLKAHFKAVMDKVDTASSESMAYALIAQSLLDFNDSHTYFIPPMRAETYDYGWEMQIIGEDCFVVAVKPGSDAEAKGLRAGDRLLRVEQFAPTRKDLWKLQYAYYVLGPRRSVKVMAQSPDGAPRELTLNTKVTAGQRIVQLHLDLPDGGLGDEYRQVVARENRATRLGDIAIWKLAGFTFDPRQAERIFDAVTKDAASLVIDMRGNSGGLVTSLQEVASHLFEQEIKLADLAGRKSQKPVKTKKRKDAFTGKVVVLIDANSASAAEVLARVIQLENRGVVVGDRSAGSVMQGVRMSGVLEGLEGFIPFEVSVTNADLVMKDGKSLEHVGVVPDEILIPTAADLAAGRDPVLARAVAILGGTLDPRTAGQMFPVQWK